LRNGFYFLAGLAFLALAKIKNILKGYSSPKPFELSERERCIAYDIQVVEAWLAHLRQYAPEAANLAGKQILELGPGSDLGVGITLLAKGCAQYNACDVNPLMKAVPDSLYEQLVRELADKNNALDIGFLREQWADAKAGKFSRLRYVLDPRFDLLSAFGEESIDLVFSQAAFEHFDDMDETVSKLSAICKPGAVLVAEIDLKTHSRWIRDRDPNNIYRYPRWLYRWFWFRGIPTRMRPCQYREIFARHGWTELRMIPLTTLADGADADSGMNGRFVGEKNQMELLTIVLCARKGPPSIP